MGEVALPRADLSHSLCDRDAERGVAVQDGDADLDLCDLAVEVPCHEPLVQQFDTMHFRLGATSAVVSAPSSPKGAAEIPGRPQGFIARHGSGSDGLPGLRVLAGRDDSLGTTVSDRIVAFAGIVSAVGGHRTDLFIQYDLTKQVG